MSRHFFLGLFGFLAASALATAHPMGNFSVNHYARLELNSHGATLTYILDLAEIPTLELLREWKLTQPTQPRLEERARTQAVEWIANLTITLDETRILPEVTAVEVQSAEGAGGLMVLRIGVEADLAVTPGSLRYKDRNYNGRTGWKEIVIRPGEGVRVATSSHGAWDLSRALSVYPNDRGLTPPQDLEAFVSWSIAGPDTERIPKNALPKQGPPAESEPGTAPFSTRLPSSPGTIEAGDSLSRLLRNNNIAPRLLLLGLLTALALGAMHALSPGHGKTIVAAYLVGSRGTIRHALLLGLVVTATHTASVFLLGLGVLLFQRYVVPERIIPVLGALSGLSIVIIGGALMYRRLRSLVAGAHADRHQHILELEMAWVREGRDNGEELTFLPRRARSPASHPHALGEPAHSHTLPEDELSMRGLIALGASGGLVPCPSALVLMLSAIAIDRTAFGLALLVSFSIGLAFVLMAIGAMVLYAKNLIPGDKAISHPAFRFVPVFSAFVVLILGVLMTLSSLGIVHPLRFL